MKLTTLIPAYKTKYLVDLFTSLIHQSRRPDLIIISDDSPRSAYTAWLRSATLAPLLVELNLHIVQGPRRGSSYANVRHLLDVWGGESDLVHLLFDDDILYPEFYERHLAAHASGRFPCSVSRRWTALETGYPVARLQIPGELANHPQRLVPVAADLIFPTTIPRCRNWLGEFSNTVMRAELRDVLARAELNGISYEGLEDIGLFLAASDRGPLCFLNDTLGAFRHGPDQNTSQLHAPVMMKAHMAWAALAIAARRSGRLDATQSADGLAHLRQLVEARYTGQERMDGFRRQLADLVDGRAGAQEAFLAAWQDFVWAP
jgi:hypothetical protein